MGRRIPDIFQNIRFSRPTLVRTDLSLRIDSFEQIVWDAPADWIGDAAGRSVLSGNCHLLFYRNGVCLPFTARERTVRVTVGVSIGPRVTESGRLHADRRAIQDSARQDPVSREYISRCHIGVPHTRGGHLPSTV